MGIFRNLIRFESLALISPSWVIIPAVSALATGCATSGNKKLEEENAALKGQVAELRQQVAAQTAKLDGVESRLTSLNDKIDGKLTADSKPDAKTDTKKIAHKDPKPTEVVSHPADRRGDDIAPSTASSDPSSGFVNDYAILDYRKAMVFLDSEKYPEALLAFSSFVEKYPDHPLAGSAQFYAGESYFRQKEYKLAEQEFERVLTSYDRSSHISHTLKRLSEVKEALNKGEAAAKNRQLLTSIFPQSPAMDLAQKATPAASPETGAGQNTAPNSGLDEPPPPTAPLEKK